MVQSPSSSTPLVSRISFYIYLVDIDTTAIFTDTIHQQYISNTIQVSPRPSLAFPVWCWTSCRFSVLSPVVVVPRYPESNKYAVFNWLLAAGCWPGIIIIIIITVIIAHRTPPPNSSPLVAGKKPPHPGGLPDFCWRPGSFMHDGEHPARCGVDGRRRP